MCKERESLQANYLSEVLTYSAAVAQMRELNYGNCMPVVEYETLWAAVNYSRKICIIAHEALKNHHCTTIPTSMVDGKCHCSDEKGWICIPPGLGAAHSEWSEHGLCELHAFIPVEEKSKPVRLFK